MDCDELLGEALENIRWDCVSETWDSMNAKDRDFKDRSVYKSVLNLNSVISLLCRHEQVMSSFQVIVFPFVTKNANFTY